MSAFTAQLARYISIAATQRTDGELLAGFLNRSQEADFAELVRRHGPMVWGACRRALPDKSDAEDAFQTVFLVLVQRGNRLISSPSIGPWLHRVAVWTTRNVRRRNARRFAKREAISEQLIAPARNFDLSLDIDAALLSLPENFRASIVLCHLLGHSRADAAAQLGCAERTLSTWLARGLAQLRERFRGLDPVNKLGIALVVVPFGLAESVVIAAVSLKSAATAASVLSPTLSQLVEGVIRMFWVKKATAVTVAMFTMFAFGVGVGVTTHQLSPAVGGEEKIGVSKSAAKAAPDIDARIAELENNIAETTTRLLRADDKIKLIAKFIAEKQEAGADAKEIEINQNAITLLKNEVVTFTRKLGALKSELSTMQELKALQIQGNALPQKPQPQSIQTTKAPPESPQDLDKQLALLKFRLIKLQAEAETSQADHAARIEAQRKEMAELNQMIAKLQSEKEKAFLAAPVNKTKGGYLELALDVRLEVPGKGLTSLTFPYVVKEVGSDGKIVGVVYFTNADILGRYLARTVKDASAPKELRIASRADTSRDHLLAAIDTGKAAGFPDVILTKAGDEEKNADLAADLAEAIKKAQAEREIRRAEEAERAAQIQLERQKQQEKMLVDLKKALEEKERELRKLKESNKQPNQNDPFTPAKP